MIERMRTVEGPYGTAVVTHEVDGVWTPVLDGAPFNENPWPTTFDASVFSPQLWQNAYQAFREGRFDGDLFDTTL